MNKKINLLNFYHSIEKIKYKNHIINEDFNLMIIKELESIINLLTMHEIEFMLTGCFGSICNTNKIYRTIKDIDIIFESKDLKRVFEVISEDYFINFRSNYINYLKNRISKEKPIRTRKKNNQLIHLDIIFIKNFVNQKYAFSIKYDNHIIKYCLPSKFYSRGRGYLRGKDIDDIDFYLPFIKI